TTLVVVALVGSWGTLVGVRRDRCGDNLRWLGLYQWFESRSFGRRVSGRAFRSPAAAQFWFVWRQKGLFLPVVVVFAFATVCLVVVIRRKGFDDFLFGTVLTGVLLPIAGLLVGLVLGQSGGGRDKSEMGSFLASRPVADRGFSNPALLVAALTTVLSWTIWAVLVVAVGALVRAADRSEVLQSFSVPSLWNLLLPLPFTWLAITSAACLMQTGRSRLMAQIFAVLFVLLLCWMFLAGPVWKLGGVAAAIPIGAMSIAATLGTLIAYAGALRSRLIPLRVALLSLSVWLLGCLAIEAWMRENASSLQGGAPLPLLWVIGFGLLSLAIMPLAAGPLAIAWNRHR
ncbi:MAG TPA: hypothetical protein VL475_09205, partial [Planctomycetaceae bacterium]|nr:hypothetical protein [Planctomycetaceae bacterium]